MSYFSESELSCNCCAQNKFDDQTLLKLNLMRDEAGFPFIVSSAYRCPKYNREIKATQTHATGQAIDILVSHDKAYQVIRLAIKYGFTGIGVSQKGDTSKRFIHLDDLSSQSNRPRPHIWSY